MAKALVVYNGLKGSTQKIGEAIAEGLRIAGVETEVKDALEIRKAEDLAGFDAYVLGSATYHGGMMQQMKQVLFMGEKANLNGKVGGSFGAYGWSGEALDRIYGTMEHVFGMDMVGDPLRLKSVVLQGGLQMAQEYGKKIAAKLGG